MYKRTTTIYTLSGVIFGFLFPATSILYLVLSQQASLSLQAISEIHAANPIQWMVDTAPIFLGLFAYIAGLRQARIEKLRSELEDRVQERDQTVRELQKLRARLEQVVNKQVVELQAAMEVASSAAAIRDQTKLINDAVQLISTRFNFYHAGIFLLDDKKQYAILRAASSEGGLRMLENGHKLKIGEVGIVGHVAASGEPRVALDVGLDAVYFNNPDLPQTRSEIALPLKVRDRVIGVLDVQSTKVSAFNAEDVSILQTLADQIALAIENARLLEASQQALQEISELYDYESSQSWRQKLSRKRIGYFYDSMGVKPASSEESIGSAVEPAEESNETSESPPYDPYRISIPMNLRGQKIGSLVLKRDRSLAAWTKEEIDLANSVISQVTLALENARLIEENRRQAYYQQMVSRITSHTQGSLDIDTVMKRAVQEIGQSLGASRVQLRLTPSRQKASKNGNKSQE